MKTRYYLLLTILFIVMIFALGCAPQQQKPETPSVEKTSASEIKQTREDFGCFYSCDFFPEGSKQMCEDWKAGRQVQWPPDCKMMQYGPCIQLCEFEKKNNPQASQNFPENNSQQQYANQNQQQPAIPTGVPASDPEAGSVYIYISDFDVGCVDKCEIFNFNYTNSRIMRIDDMTGKGWIAFAPDAKTEDARYFHKWHMSAPHGMFVVERSK